MMHDLNISLEDLHFFYYVVSKGGYLKAAKSMNICQAKASRRVAHIEKILGTTLLHCNMREITLTRAGQRVFKMAEEMLCCANQTFTLVKNEHDTMEGEIAISMTAAFGRACITPWLKEFQETHPKVRFQMIFRDDSGDADLMLGEADIAISSCRPEPRESLHSQPLCEYPFYIFGSKSYLKNKGHPRIIQDLDHHQLIGWEGPLPSFIPRKLFNALLYKGREENSPRVPCVTVTNDSAIIASVSEGLGLALMPQFLENKDKTIKRIKLQGETSEFWGKNVKYISYPKFTLKSYRHRVLIDFIIAKSRETFSKSSPNRA